MSLGVPGFQPVSQAGQVPSGHWTYQSLLTGVRSLATSAGMGTGTKI